VASWVEARSLDRPKFSIVSLTVYNLACLVDVGRVVDSNSFLDQEQLWEAENDIEDHTCIEQLLRVDMNALDV
jgi:hypothetical protein